MAKTLIPFTSHVVGAGRFVLITGAGSGALPDATFVYRSVPEGTLKRHASRPLSHITNPSSTIARSVSDAASAAFVSTNIWRRNTHERIAASGPNKSPDSGAPGK